MPGMNSAAGNPLQTAGPNVAAHLLQQQLKAQLQLLQQQQQQQPPPSSQQHQQLHQQQQFTSAPAATTTTSSSDEQPPQQQQQSSSERVKLVNLRGDDRSPPSASRKRPHHRQQQQQPLEDSEDELEGDTEANQMQVNREAGSRNRRSSSASHKKLASRHSSSKRAKREGCLEEGELDEREVSSAGLAGNESRPHPERAPCGSELSSVNGDDDADESDFSADGRGEPMAAHGNGASNFSSSDIGERPVQLLKVKGDSCHQRGTTNEFVLDRLHTTEAAAIRADRTQGGKQQLELNSFDNEDEEDREDDDDNDDDETAVAAARATATDDDTGNEPEWMLKPDGASDNDEDQDVGAAAASANFKLEEEGREDDK